MKANPYRTLIGKDKSPFLPGITKIGGQNYPFTSNKGEINASSQADLLVQIGNALKTASKGELVKGSVRDTAERAKERRQALVEAVNDKTGQAMFMLGQAIGAEIIETTDREGFARRICLYNEIGQGETNLVTVKEKNVVGFIAVSPSQVTPVEIRQRQLMPPEFHINGFILIDTAELAKSSGDLLEEKYEEGLEAIMVQEDRLWKTMADQAAVVRNTIQNFATFTPGVFARLINQVARWGIPTPSCLFASDLWQDIIANSDFAGVMDPVTQWELLQEGYLGTMYGVTMNTDNFRQPNLKVLDAGEVYIVGAPINHGVFTVRGTMTAEPVNRYSQGEPKKGWFLDEIASMVLGNAMSVARGRKI